MIAYRLCRLMGWSWQDVMTVPAQVVRDILYMRQTELEYEERMRQRAH